MAVSVVGCFFTVDFLIDYLARHYYPALFNQVIYPIDYAGAMEYTLAAGVLFVSSRKNIEWLSLATYASLAFSIAIVAQKLIFRA